MIYFHKRTATAGLTGDAESDEGGWSGKKDPAGRLGTSSMGNPWEIYRKHMGNPMGSTPFVRLGQEWTGKSQGPIIQQPSRWTPASSRGITSARWKNWDRRFMTCKNCAHRVIWKLKGSQMGLFGNGVYPPNDNFLPSSLFSDRPIFWNTHTKSRAAVMRRCCCWSMVLPNGRDPKRKTASSSSMCRRVGHGFGGPLKHVKTKNQQPWDLFFFISRLGFREN